LATWINGRSEIKQLGAIFNFNYYYSFFYFSLFNLENLFNIFSFAYFAIFLIIILSNVKEALIGDLLGDGHLRFTHKDINGKVTGNSHYAMTLKNYDYAFFLWKHIYSPIFYFYAIATLA